jgi:Predicted membrane protein (DUF2243)
LSRLVAWLRLRLRIPGPARCIVADGLFHAVMYFVVAVGLWLLCRSQGELAEAGADLVLVGEVTYLRDGDTTEMAIRLSGLAAPEWNEPSVLPRRTP